MAIVAGPEIALNLQADHATGTAVSRTVELTDQSTVIVAPASAIAVSFTPDERRVRLLAGEAYLEVTPDSDRPFRLSAGGVQVTVLGTGFNVSRSEDGVEVGVAHGKVHVGRSGSAQPVTTLLEAGEFVRINGSGRMVKDRQPASQVGAWRQNQLIAQDQPLRDVLNRLRRYYTGMIIVTDDSLSTQPVTGVYDLENPTGALRAIARSQNAVVRAITPWLLIVSRS